MHSRMVGFDGLMTVYAENIRGNSAILAYQGGSLPKNAVFKLLEGVSA